MKLNGWQIISESLSNKNPKSQKIIKKKGLEYIPDEYYTKYTENSYLPEKSELELERKIKKFIFLYVGIQQKNIESIKSKGIIPSNRSKSDIFHILGDKPVIFLTSVKSLAKIFTKRFLTRILKPGFGYGPILIAKVYTNKLHFYLRTKNLDNITGDDEYVYTTKIPPQDIIFPNDPLYEKIENQYNYLSLR